MSSAPATDLLIIGAGPFGLSLAAWAQHLGINHRIVGEPMDFWNEDMPEGMILRSDCDWHLDPLEIHTLEHYVMTLGLTRRDVEPLSLSFYLSYARWFQEQKEIAAEPGRVQRLDRATPDGPFVATLADGTAIHAGNVAIAVGFQYFKHSPPQLIAMLPAESYSHTCDLVDFRHLAGKRCLIVGGRQAAFEWAALIHEAGAERVDVVHRHDTPAFTEADWSWVLPILDHMVEEPGWFRDLAPDEQENLNRRFWAEGRLKVEPWLAPRVFVDGISIWPNSRIVGCDPRPDGAQTVQLEAGERLTVDHVIFATGYQVDLERVPFLATGNLLPWIDRKDGYPVLDTHFQTSVPGLFITSMPATRDFGGFFAFTAAVRASARIIGQALTAA